MSLAASVTSIGTALTAGGLAIAQLRHDAGQAATRKRTRHVSHRNQPRPITAGERVQVRFPSGMFNFEVTDPSPHPTMVPNGQSSLYLLARQYGVPGAPVYAVRRDQAHRLTQPANPQRGMDERHRKEQHRDRIGRALASMTAAIAIALAIGATWVALQP